MNYISEAAKKDADYQLQCLVDGMERNDYEIYKDVESMPKPMRIVAETISVSYMMLHSQNLGEKIFNEGQIRKSQYIFEKGILMLKAFLSKEGFKNFLDSCDYDATNPESNLKFLLGYQEEEI
jgi:hypothetical protein